MSILFYRRPDYLAKPNGPVNAKECMRFAARAENAKRAIPDGLSFDDVLENRSLPPCALSDFMDYLVYIEHDAENLQFFLWYKDYVQRFNELPESEQKLSAPWTPENMDIPNLTNDADREAERAKRSTIKGMLQNGYQSKDTELFTEDQEILDRHTSVIKDNQSMTSSTVVGSIAPSTAEVTAQAGLKWQPFTIQPLREEVNRVMRHYLAFNSPRELNLSHRDRALCLHALQHTTHPSAFAPALKIVESALRGQSHPNFIRWSICNGNRPRVFFVRTMGITHIALGFLIAILLILSHASRWWRILQAPVMFVGISTMVAAYKGLCVILHKSHQRNLRPWEQDLLDAETGQSRRNSSSTAQPSIQLDARKGDMKEDDASSTFHVSHLQAFGPKNSFEGLAWQEKYAKKPLMSKVFEESTWTQDAALRLLQDKIVKGANLWAIILTTALTIIFIALPRANLY